jgi:hypothetical protein
MLNHKIDLNCKTQRLTKRFCQALTFFITIGVLTLLPLAAQPADGTFSLGGFSEIVNNTPALGHPKAFQVPSTCLNDCLKGGSFGELTTSSVIYLPDHTLRFKDLNTLSTDYRRWDGDCGGGSPRFEIGLDTNGDGVLDGRIFVYLGPLYNFTNCERDWQNTGNFINFGGDYRWDLTQFQGMFYSSYREAIAQLGEAAICYIILVVDGSWYPYITAPFGVPYKQIFQFDRVTVNKDVYRANQAASFAKSESPSIARLNLEQYVSGISAPRNLYSQESYLGRQFSLRTLLRMTGQSRTSQSSSRSSRR